MKDSEFDIKVASLPVKDAAHVRSIRLLPDGSHVALAMLVQDASHSNVVSVALVDHPANLRTFPPLDSPFGLPSWDLTGPILAAPAIVWTKPGSAFSPLSYRSSSGTEVVLTGAYPSGVFEKPRFVRSGKQERNITAVASLDTAPVLALFSASLDKGQAKFLPLPSAGSGLLEDGLLLQEGTSYYLFVKLRVPSALKPDSAGNIPERKDGGGGGTQPGLIYGLRLDAKLQPVGSPFQPIGATPIFEFDASLSDERVFLFATTEKGFIIAKSRDLDDVLHWTSSPDIPTPGELVSPAVVGIGKAAYIAVIESVGTPRCQVRFGKYQPGS